MNTTTTNTPVTTSASDYSHDAEWASEAYPVILEDEDEGIVVAKQPKATKPSKAQHKAATKHAAEQVRLRHVNPNNLPADAGALRALYGRIRAVAPLAHGEFNTAAKAALKGADGAAWVKAALQVSTPCDKCNATGTYGWGACVNGVMTHSGVCFACGGRGRQTHADWVRNWAYWAFFAHISL